MNLSFKKSPLLLSVSLAAITLSAFAILQCSPIQNDNASVPPDFSNLPVSKNPTFAKVDLIDIHEVDPSILVNLQYTRPTSIAKFPLYAESFPALLRPETALRLRHANALVKKQGLRIKIWDAYRPPSAQWKLYEASGRNDTFVANPANAPSQHSCGTAVDITLVSLSGKAVPMPTGFDSFTPQASSSYKNSDPVIAENLRILQNAMHKAGFYPLPAEWWHYIDISYKKYPNTITIPGIQ